MNITLSQVYRDRTPKSALQRNLFIEFLLPKAMGNRKLRRKIRFLDRCGRLDELLPASSTKNIRGQASFA